MLRTATTTSAAVRAATTATVSASAVRFFTTGVIGAATATTGTIITHKVIQGENLEISGITTRSGSEVER